MKSVPRERTEADRIRAYASIEEGQAHRARDAADAIFKSKPQTYVGVDANNESGAMAPTPQTVRAPRVLTVRQPDTNPALELSVAAKLHESAASDQVGPEIPHSAHGRIRALVNHGMTAKQVAKLYGVKAHTIQHITSKAKPLR